MSDAEATNIARYLGLPLERFLALHTHAYSKVEGFRLLRSNIESEVSSRQCVVVRAFNNREVLTECCPTELAKAKPTRMSNAVSRPRVNEAICHFGYILMEPVTCFLFTWQWPQGSHALTTLGDPCLCLPCHMTRFRGPSRTLPSVLTVQPVV